MLLQRKIVTVNQKFLCGAYFPFFHDNAFIVKISLRKNKIHNNDFIKEMGLVLWKFAPHERFCKHFHYILKQHWLTEAIIGLTSLQMIVLVFLPVSRYEKHSKCTVEISLDFELWIIAVFVQIAILYAPSVTTLALLTKHKIYKTCILLLS